MNARATSAARGAGDPIGVAVLGSTGSVGRQTLDVIAHFPERFSVVALAAGANTRLLVEQARRFRPDLVVGNADELTELGGVNARVETGAEGLIAAATHPAAEIVVVATSGHAAILPTYRAIEHGKTIALANKETIVCAGELIVPLARRHGVEIRPVDSEHSAIWQARGQATSDEIARLILTASGGPFRAVDRAELATVTAEQALSHPTWRMGGKITIDSATMMNKGLEVIEAHWLFDTPYERIEVVIHPESIIHSLVEFRDGSQIAQLGRPDMRLPIQYALTYPEHIHGPCERLNLLEVGALTFEPADEAKFPALRLVRQAGLAGGGAPTVLSAADEVAVEAFLSGRISFLTITEIVEETLATTQAAAIGSIVDIVEIDRLARENAAGLVSNLGR